MDSMDFGLVVALDALLRENSVTAAAAALHTSAPAMSRTLARLRRVLDDPLLVRAGRRLVPTPRALELRDEVAEIVRRASVVFEPAPDLDPARVKRDFVVQASDAILPTLLPRLLRSTQLDAPGIGLTFRPDPLGESTALRDGDVHLEINVITDPDPETRVVPLFSVRMAAVVRNSHPLTNGRVSVKRFADADHIVVSRRGHRRGPIDDELTARGLARRVPAVVPTYATSLLLARDSDLVCLAYEGTSPDLLAGLGLRFIPVPFELPTSTVSMAWHPRHDHDRAHGWLRDRVREILETPEIKERR